MRIWRHQHRPVGTCDQMPGLVSTRRKRGRWSRRAVLLLAVAGVEALLLTVNTGTTKAFAALSPTPVRPAGTIPAPRWAPNPSSITAAAASTCATAAYKAGFPMDSFTATEIGNYRTVVVAVAIGMAESGCNPSAINGSGSCAPRGLWQVEQCYWPRVTEACLQNAQCNGDAAWGYVYRAGDTFCWWQTYDPICGSGYNGAWVNYISDAQTAVANLKVTLGNTGTGLCLAADASNAINGGTIWQYRCISSNVYEEWSVQQGSATLNPVLRNVGTGLCLDTEANQAQNHGKIFQWHCKATSDVHQQWAVEGNVNITNNVVAKLNLRNSPNGTGTCLAADASAAQNRGTIWQWGCSGYNSISYLDWN